MTNRDSFLHALPKTDLHVHLDGSLRLNSLIDMAKERNVTLPSMTPEGLKELVFKDQYESLVEYLQGFAYTTAVLQDPESLERTAYELAEDNFSEGVRYFEVRFAPQLHAHYKLGMDEILKAVDKGLAKATAKWNAKLAADQSRRKEPEYAYSIIVCAMRYFDENSSSYYKDLFRVHPFSTPKQVMQFGSLELAQAAVAIRNRYGIPITGFDLAGREDGYPAEDHRQAYAYAHKHFLKKTVHAGEAYGPESIFQAITDLHADRIGHGYYLLSPNMVAAPGITNKEEYVTHLAEYIADRRITLEICLTSNMQTNPSIKKLSDHAFKKILKARLSTTICTDNRLVSNTTVTKELGLAIDNFALSPHELKNIIIYGFKRSFYPGSYIEKRAWVRKVIDLYDKIAQEHKATGDFWDRQRPKDL